MIGIYSCKNPNKTIEVSQGKDGLNIRFINQDISSTGFLDFKIVHVESEGVYVLTGLKYRLYYDQKNGIIKTDIWKDEIFKIS